MIRRVIILLLIVGCEEPSQHGCLDSQACNYDADQEEILEIKLHEKQ